MRFGKPNDFLCVDGSIVRSSSSIECSLSSLPIFNSLPFLSVCLCPTIAAAASAPLAHSAHTRATLYRTQISCMNMTNFPYYMHMFFFVYVCFAASMHRWNTLDKAHIQTSKWKQRILWIPATPQKKEPIALCRSCCIVQCWRPSSHWGQVEKACARLYSSPICHRVIAEK